MQQIFGDGGSTYGCFISCDDTIYAMEVTPSTIWLGSATARIGFCGVSIIL
jgi:hypothetical protein